MTRLHPRSEGLAAERWAQRAASGLTGEQLATVEPRPSAVVY